MPSSPVPSTPTSRPRRRPHPRRQAAAPRAPAGAAPRTRRWTRWPTRCCSTSRPVRCGSRPSPTGAPLRRLDREPSGEHPGRPRLRDPRARPRRRPRPGALPHRRGHRAAPRHPVAAATGGSRACSPTGTTTRSPRSHSTCGTSPPTSRPPCPRSPEGPTDDRLHPATRPALATGSRAAAPAAAAEPGPPAGPLTHRQIVTILIGLMMGMFLAALDQTIVASGDAHHRRRPPGPGRTRPGPRRPTSSPRPSSRRSTASSATSTGARSCSSSRSRSSSSARCCAPSRRRWVSLAAFRAVQGLGAGGLFSLALAIIGDIVPPRERAKYQGYFLAVFGTASVLGPVIGGFFAGQETILGIDGWRWVFLVNVPIGIAALAVVSQDAAPAPHPPRPPHRLGRRRAALGRARAAAPRRRAGPRVGLDVDGSPSPATSSASLGAIGFFWQEWRMKEEAILPLAMFRNRTVGVVLGRVRAHRCGDVRRSRRAAALPADRQGRDARRRPACSCCR